MITVTNIETFLPTYEVGAVAVVAVVLYILWIKEGS